MPDIQSFDTPLEGVTVVDLTRYLPGPYCTRLLADLGAAVIKIEPPGGDPMRAIAWYDLLNAGKRELTLDLRSDHGRRELEAVLAAADVCVEGFRPSTAKALGVDAVSLRARYPALVHCSLSGYGQAGSDADRAGHDLNYQAEAGLLGPSPAVPAHLLADITAALHGAIHILAALVGRGRTRQGASLDLALARAAASWAAFKPPPVLSGAYACYNVYQAADGGWLALGALESKFWARFCDRIGRPEWIPAQFAPDPVRTALISDLQALFRDRDRDSWLAAFEGVDCCLTTIR